MKGALNEQELGPLGTGEGIPDTNKYAVRSYSGHTVDQSR